ncbi:unnamed protein product [Symbiodinium pilosum]|uniref:Glycoside hydrolase family 5 domain-containing protein n=1 Tax=Symbiodinium pilosum TaxID=2952 RepID=A0A812MUM3_SYMPI|nr:unnamed protein product [Symbiodinium pilosum]
MSEDLLGPYSPLKDRWLLDVHHYFNWPAMCNVYGAEESYISVPCVCEANVPNTTHQYEQHAWAGYMKMGLLDKGYRLYIGEWSAGLQVARNCNNPTKLPNPKQAQVMWRAQKLSFLRNYLHYQGHAAQDKSSFFGDYYWSGRMGHNWNADPSVCCCHEDRGGEVLLKSRGSRVCFVRAGSMDPYGSLVAPHKSQCASTNLACITCSRFLVSRRCELKA